MKELLKSRGKEYGEPGGYTGKSEVNNKKVWSKKKPRWTADNSQANRGAVNDWSRTGGDTNELQTTATGDSYSRARRIDAAGREGGGAEGLPQGCK